MDVEICEAVLLKNTWIEVPHKLIPSLIDANIVIKDDERYRSSPFMADREAIERIRKAITIYNMHKTPLAPETLAALGFTSHTPAGNRQEPVWMHHMIGGAFTAPSFAEILEAVRRQAMHQAKQDIRSQLRRTLGIDA